MLVFRRKGEALQFTAECKFSGLSLSNIHLFKYNIYSYIAHLTQTWIYIQRRGYIMTGNQNTHVYRER